MPQYFRENNPILNLGFQSMSPILELQYQKEERTRLLTRVKAASNQLPLLLTAMKKEVLSTEENIAKLRAEMSELYEDDHFLHAKTMGELLVTSLQMLEVQPIRKRGKFKVTIA
jgi:hypothetical protein